MAKAISERGTKGFYLWLKANQPKLYAEVARRSSKGVAALSGVGDLFSDLYGGSSAVASDPAATATTASTSSGLADSIKNVVMGAAQIFLAKKQLDTQGQIVDAQLARAKAGLPPLNINAASFGLQPTIGVGLTASTQNLVMYGGLALLALLAFGVFKPGRK
jgi:hypothetical protein